MKQLQRAFVTGVLVLVPVFITINIFRWVIATIDNIAKLYLPNFILKLDFPGLGLVIALALILLIGSLAQNLAGEWVLNVFDHTFRRIKFVGGIYGAIRKFLETVVTPGSDRFSAAVLVEFPRSGVYSIGFRTGKPDSKIPTQNRHLVNVFVPLTPNPTSGFYLLVPEEELVALPFTVQEAFKLVISLGIVTSEEAHK
ncbi:MAG: DUF502 domain-containing protein [Proteobacteria bacterium]|nr:DUF502 domain-containing protein [Pseudomonadota bacterium]NDC25164.1 DUF502 domain-containing protein [Pseudomonadota bacterium]NDD05102.1 DUF502 domain-containing protein [Pseudomonadota bacterium]NDG27728.1 DUF502 domain-containing protein [Pseudomonadota bacterium]